MTDPPSRTNAVARAVVVVVVGAGVYGFGFWVLWHSLLTSAYGRPGINNAIKDYYLGDQFAYLGIAANVAAGRSSFLEPYTATGASIYPSAYYWLVGRVAGSSRLNVFGAWNLLGVAVDSLLFAGTSAMAWFLTRRSWAWVFGPLPALIGTYQYWTIGSWRAIYGAHAVLWPAAASLFSPGAEPAALLLAMVAMGLLTIEPTVHTSRRLAIAGGAGIAVGCTLHVHTYVAILAATVASLWFLVRSTQLATTASARRGIGLCGAAAVVAVAFVPESFPILRVGVVIAGAAATAFVSRLSRSRLAPSLLAFILGAALSAAPMLVRIASQIGDPDSFLYLRQASGVATDLSLPLLPVLVHSAPVLLLAAGCLLHLHRRRRSSTDGGPADGWSATLAALLVGGALLVGNEAWGLQQEPYRFLPYCHFLVAVFAVPWLVSLPSGRRWPAAIVRAATVVAIAATIPTTLRFARETPAILQAPAAEQAAFRRAAEALPADGLTLLDSCLPRGAFKALTGARVVGMNEGLALARDASAIRSILAMQREGVLADGKELEAARVRGFVTIDGCNGPARAALLDRFGPPQRTVRLVPPSMCGLQPLELEVYVRRPDESGRPITWQVRPVPPAEPAHPWAPCTLSGRRSDVG